VSGEKLFEIVKNMINKFFRFEEFCGLPDTPENRAKFISNVPLGRLCEAEDVADACLFLASDDAKFVTGINMEVDGGRAV
jgi:NAD(P)-dependent dehydrogenase (short-subunit alcohol dehydrogenase family)